MVHMIFDLKYTKVSHNYELCHVPQRGSLWIRLANTKKFWCKYTYNSRVFVLEYEFSFMFAQETITFTMKQHLFLAYKTLKFHSLTL